MKNALKILIPLHMFSLFIQVFSAFRFCFKCYTTMKISIPWLFFYFVDFLFLHKKKIPMKTANIKRNTVYLFLSNIFTYSFHINQYKCMYELTEIDGISLWNFYILYFSTRKKKLYLKYFSVLSHRRGFNIIIGWTFFFNLFVIEIQNYVIV